MSNSQRSTQHEAGPRDGFVLAGFLVFNAVFRLALLNLNEGEYTDGILQIIQFEQRDSYWPPLYTALIWALRAVGVEPILAGRLISWACSVLLILPLWYLAKMWGGRRTALYTLALYTVSAMALRWSIRVMTDMPFTFFFHMACAGLLVFWAKGAPSSIPSPAFSSNTKEGDEETQLMPVVESDHTYGSQKRSISAAGLLTGITIFSVLATLTRYQGLLLAPLILMALLTAWQRRIPRLWLPVLMQGLWLALPVWFFFQRFGHLEQVLERESPLGPWVTLLNYWNIFESFVYLTPYFITLPVYVFMVIGLVRDPGRDFVERGQKPIRKTPIRIFFLYIALAILTAQSAFQSFQSRYLLPLLPLALTFAGGGLAWMEFVLTKKGKWGRRWALALSGGTIVWSLIFALAVVFLQRGAFGDLYAAGRFIRDLNLPRNARIFTNESYKPHINGIKLGFAAERKAELIPELRPAPGAAAERMAAGSLVVLHSAYSGGLQGQEMLIRGLRERFGYNLQPLETGVFSSFLVPLLPDIMEEPGTHQNPLAVFLRYHRQDFRTQVFIIQ